MTALNVLILIQRPLRISKSNPNPAAVRRNEFYTGMLERLLDRFQIGGGDRRTSILHFCSTYGRNTHGSRIRKLSRAPADETPRGPNLRTSDFVIII